MSLPLEFLKSIPLDDLQRLVAYKENEVEIQSLYKDLEKHLKAAQKYQTKIDELITQGTGIVQKKRHGPSVRAMCTEVLKNKKNGLTAAQIKDGITKLYPHRQSKTLYNQVFIALTRNKEFKRVSDKKFILK